MENSSHTPFQNADEARLLALFDDLKIPTQTIYHAPAYTVEDAVAVRGQLSGGHCKALFLKSKKGKYVLIIMDETGRLDANHLSRELGLGRLSFASPQDMVQNLGVRPGSVTPFALINWPRDQELVLILDAQMMKNRPLHYHPLHNCATTAIAPEDLLRFIKYCKQDALIRDLPLK